MIKQFCKFFTFIFVIITSIELFACSSGYSEPPQIIDEDIIPPPPAEEQIQNKLPDEFTAMENLSIASQKITESGIYRTESLGEVSAMGNIYTQTVKTQKKVVNNECFVQSASYSSIKKTAEQQYFNGSKIYYRTGSDIDKNCNVNKWSDEIKDYPKEDFLNNYGCEPFGITKYYIHNDFIINSEVVKNDDDTYDLVFELSSEAAANMVREIKTQSGAKEYPSFISIKITATIDTEWKIKKIITEEKYEIKMFINLKCSTHFEEQFFDIGNKNLEITEKEYFNII